MSASPLILSEDAVFSRMLELEFRMHRISVRTARQADAVGEARVYLVDLDSALPPADCDGRVIGFTRSPSILASDPERRCSMILHRPFSMEMLVEEVHTLLSDEEQMPSAVAREEIGGLTLEGTALSWRGQAVSLSPTEAALMRCLLSDRTRPLSREMLEEAIGASAANKTDVYVCLLRKKLERLTGSPMIRTVRGVGYRLD